MTDRRDLDRWHTAIRAAGHAVLGRVLDISTRPISIDPHDASSSAIFDEPALIDFRWHDQRRQRPARAYTLGRIITRMAGEEAEIVLLGSSRDDEVQHLSRLRPDVYALADSAPDALRLVQRMRRLTSALARRHLTKIEQLALALYVEGEIIADDEIRTKAGLPPAPPFNPSRMEYYRAHRQCMPIDEEPSPRMLH